MKWQLPIIMALLCIGLAQACDTTYLSGNDVMVIDNVIPPGLGADCNITTYLNVTMVDTAWMDKDGLAYTHTLTNLSPGVYSSAIYCNYTYNATVTNIYEGECKFEVSGGDSDTMMAIALILIGAIIVFGFFSRVAEDEHIKTLLSFITMIMMVGVIWVGYLLTIEIGLNDGIQRLVFVIALISMTTFVIVLFYTIIMFLINRMKDLKEAKI